MAKILTDDIMVLQRKNARDYREPHTPPGDYPNLMYDLETFSFYGSDLEESVNEYVSKNHEFVLLKGDVMSGNLEIEYPTAGSPGGQEPAELRLTGNQTDGKIYSKVSFKNQGSGSNFTMSIGAVHPVTNSALYRSHIKIGDKSAVTDQGKLYINRHVCSKGGGGFLTYIPDDDWDTSANEINSTINDNQNRLRWTRWGGSLNNATGGESLRWNSNTYGVKLFDETGVEVVVTEDEHLRYSNQDILIEEPNDVVHKKYTDDQDALYIPLEGTRVADVSEYPNAGSVWGPIDFTTTGWLNAKMGVGLKLKYTDIDVITVEADTGPYGAKLTVHSDSYYNDNSLIDVKYPATSFQPTAPTPEDTHAVPRKYVDDRDKELLALFSNPAASLAPVGMINAYVGATAPGGWFICDGSSFVAADYPELAALLGTNSVPDLAGRFLAQEGGNLGSSLGGFPNAKTGKPKSGNFSITAQTAQNGAHNHSMQADGAHTHNHSLQVVIDKQKQASNSNNGSGGYELIQKNGSHKDGSTTYYVDGHLSASANHSHDINNSSNHNHDVTVVHTGWDDSTRPDTYVVNWIIKHDHI